MVKYQLSSMQSVKRLGPEFMQTCRKRARGRTGRVDQSNFGETKGCQHIANILWNFN